MEIMALVGSLRQQSYNMHLVKAMQEHYRDKMNVTIPDLGLFPFFNQDEENNPPLVVQQFKDAVAEADGIIIITPEYNWSIPGVLKNALDWVSRGERVMIGKPVMTLGATLGMVGTARAQLHLRDILSAPGIQANLLPPGQAK